MTRKEGIMGKEVNRELLHSLFRLKSTLNTEFVKGASSVVKDISLPEYVLMKEIAENRGDLTAIGEYLSVSKSAVSQMLSSLEKKGYLTRRINVRNRRNIVVRLTRAGRVALRKQSDEFDERYENIVKDLDEGEVNKIIEIINRLQCAISDEAAPEL